MKVLVSDFDKTFYLSKEGLEENKKAVKKFKDKGNLFIFSTGRSYYDMKPQIDKYELEYDYLIIDHGATILDKNDNIICTYKIKKKIIPELIKDLKIKDYNINYYTSPINNDLYNIYFCCNGLNGRVNYDNDELTKIAVKYNKDTNIDDIYKYIKEKYTDINLYLVSYRLIEIISNKTSKAKSIEVLKNYLNLNNEDIYTIGDGYSDIEMVENYNGFAMKDSVSKLKEVATKEYDSVSSLIKDIL